VKFRQKKTVPGREFERGKKGKRGNDGRVGALSATASSLRQRIKKRGERKRGGGPTPVHLFFRARMFPTCHAPLGKKGKKRRVCPYKTRPYPRRPGSRLPAGKKKKKKREKKVTSDSGAGCLLQIFCGAAASSSRGKGGGGGGEPALDFTTCAAEFFQRNFSQRREGKEVTRFRLGVHGPAKRKESPAVPPLTITGGGGEGTRLPLGQLFPSEPLQCSAPPSFLPPNRQGKGGGCAHQPYSPLFVRGPYEENTACAKKKKEGGVPRHACPSLGGIRLVREGKR